MASKAMAKVPADWAKISSKLTAIERTKLNRLKSQVDGTAIKVNSLPDSLPKIDWSHYKATASDPKIVEELEKKYSTYKVEVPKAPQSRIAELHEAKKEDIARCSKFLDYAKSCIDSAEAVKKKYEVMIPVKDMLEEDWALTFPDWSYSSIENPSIAPHYGRMPGLSLEEAIAFEQPDLLPYSTKTAWKDWEVRKKKFYT